MTKILNHINTYADLTAYNNDKEKDFPNISYIQGSDEVKWEKTDPYINVCKYNVTSTSKATKLLGSNTDITYQIIDGVKQDTVQTTYTFNTMGEHIVEYKFNGTSIDDGAFISCSGLTSVTIGNSVSSIGYYAFGSCTKLTSVTIGNGVTSIDDYAFGDCTGLTSIIIPDSVTSIGVKAFQNCTDLTSVTIGNGVTNIGDSAFYGCKGLTNIVVDSANTVFDSRDNCNAIIKTSTNELIAGCKNTVIPNTVTSIGEYAFKECSGLTSITIPNGVTSIGFGAFFNCTDLTSVTIGNGITNIDQQAFVNCTGLTSLTINAITPPTLGANAFYNTNANFIIYVPAESLEAYKAATNWSSLASRIKPIS